MPRERFGQKDHRDGVLRDLDEAELGRGEAHDPEDR
jgi:hypothetical protein